MKMDFPQKTRWVKDGYKTPDPETSNYAGVVSKENIKIALIHPALNDVDFPAADIWNTYLQASTPENTMRFVVLRLALSVRGGACCYSPIRRKIGWS